MRVLHLAKNLTLPLDAVTQTIAILAKRRAGKSYTMRRLVEQLFKAGQQIVIVDPKGDQWGVRSAADGKGPGLPIVILGGERGDVPLEPSGGEVVAKLVVEERVSVLLDVSLFRKHEVATFMTAFLENLYRLKAREVYRTPMMLVIDEADAIAPQKPQKGEERMLGAAEDIVRRGGQRGIGCILVTQRSAVLNKNVLTQAQMLIALRTIAPQDLAAMNAWIDVHGTLEQKKTLMDSLPSLPVGDAWFWSPGWPTAEGIFQRVHVLPIETFDSGATPKSGEKRVEPKHAADVDLEALKRQMAATIEKAKADDPRELRKQIAELKKELAKKGSTPVQTVASPKTVEKFVLKDSQVARLETLMARIGAEADRHGKAMAGFWGNLNEVADVLLAAVRAVANDRPRGQAPPPLRAVPPASVSRTVSPRRASENSSSPADGLTPAKQKILNGLAFLHGIGASPADKTQLALIVGVSPTSGGYFNNLGALRSSGLIDYPSGGTVALTDAGAAIAATDGVPSTTEELHDAIRAKLPPAKWKILEALIPVYPKSVNKDDLADAIGVSPTSGGYFNNLGSLRSLGLVDYPQPGTVAAQPVLFLEER
jgi:Helicase HerA, central domain